MMLPTRAVTAARVAIHHHHLLCKKYPVQSFHEANQLSWGCSPRTQLNMFTMAGI